MSESPTIPRREDIPADEDVHEYEPPELASIGTIQELTLAGRNSAFPAGGSD